MKAEMQSKISLMNYVLSAKSHVYSKSSQTLESSINNHTAYHVINVHHLASENRENSIVSLGQNDKQETNKDFSEWPWFREPTKLSCEILNRTRENVLTEPLIASLTADNVALALVLANKLEELLERLAFVLLNTGDAVSPSTANLGGALPENLCHVASCFVEARLVEVVLDEFLGVPGLGYGIAGWVIDVALTSRNPDAEHVFAVRADLSTL
jgi:hypothetical protein